jgi:hypothetical protein
MSFAERIIKFNHALKYEGETLPPGIQVMNPFSEPGEAMKIADLFYRKYYNDDRPRSLILGINPGRFGAGLTGIPFTDPKRLMAECQIPYEGRITHEPSSAYVYEVIRAYGGTEAFYGKFHINSLCPLGFTKTDANGRVKNYNYYDSKELAAATRGFIVANIKKQLALGVHPDTCICLGTGKNEGTLQGLNKEYGFFKKIVALEHPRFIMQYRSARKPFYIDKYISVLKAPEH